MATVIDTGLGHQAPAASGTDTVKLSARHIPALDGVRGFAAISIVIFHYAGGKQSPYASIRLIAEGINIGWAAVSLFFVLSGFLISGILLDGFNKRKWWVRFYSRRSLRIFPLYYLALSFAVCMTLWTMGSTWPLRSIVPYSIYLQNIPAVFRVFPTFPNASALSHFWSLAVEEQFYLIWPLLLAWRHRNLLSARRMCLLIWALSLAFRVSIYWLGVRDIWAIGFLFARAGELSMGVYLALAIRDQRTDLFLVQNARRVFISSLVALLAIIAWARSTDVRTCPMATLGIAVNGILFASMIALCLRPGLLASFFSAGWLRWLGRVSYGVYVYHILLGSLFDWAATSTFPGLGHNGHLLLVAFYALVGTLAIATVSFYGFESQFLRLKAHFAN